jgi:surface protein
MNFKKKSYILIILLIMPLFSSLSSIQTNLIISDGHTLKIAADTSSFITIWDTTLDGISASNQIKLPLDSSGTYNFYVDWGDSNTDLITSWNQTEVTHAYAPTGIYTINITGQCEGWSFNDIATGPPESDAEKLLKIVQWGDLRLGNSGRYFSGCENLNITATDILNVSGVTDMSYAFKGCEILTDIANIDLWDVSTVTDMSHMFERTDFNHDLSTWDVSQVTNMRMMFYYDNYFNGNISTWDVSKVTNMNHMFYRASSFNSDISGWNVSSLIDIDWMFSYANNFNQDIGGWNVSSVTNMIYALQGLYLFNYSLNSWDVSKVTDMSGLFYGCDSFNQDLSSWNVSKVTDMGYMFYGCDFFNQDLSSWDVSKVADMERMFLNCIAFNQDLSLWDVSDVDFMRRMFYGCDSFNQDLSSWDVSDVGYMDGMFYSCDSFDQDLSSWDVSNVWNMNQMFYDCDSFNQDLSSWDVSNVWRMEQMFYSCDSFDQDLGSWDVSMVWNMNQIFQGVTLSTVNYDSLLIGWASLDTLQNDVDFHGGFSKYSAGAATTARGILTGTWGWNIIDGGQSSDPYWDEFPENQIINYGVNFYYNVNASDIDGIDQYWVNDTLNFNIDGNGVITNNTILTWGDYNLRIHVNDTNGNEISADIIITVNDTINPLWDEIPENQSIPQHVSFSYDVNASDNVEIDQYWINDTSNFKIDGNGVITNNTILAIGDYNLRINVNDTTGNELSIVIIISVIDISIPTWVSPPVNQFEEYGTHFIYDVDAVDDIAIDQYWINDTINFNIDGNGLITNITILLLGEYHLSIHVNDTSGNELNESIIITIEDNTNPTWDETPENQIIAVNQNFYYDINASDNYAIDEYWISDPVNFSIDSSGIITNNTILLSKQYSLMIYVDDSVGNQINILITITVIIDDEKPVWDEIPEDQIIFLGHSLQYDVNASDNIEIDFYWINDTTHFTIAQDGVITNIKVLKLGNYFLMIYVNDTSGNTLNISITITVEERDVPPGDIGIIIVVVIIIGLISSIGAIIVYRRKTTSIPLKKPGYKKT